VKGVDQCADARMRDLIAERAGLGRGVEEKRFGAVHRFDCDADPMGIEHVAESPEALDGPGPLIGIAAPSGKIGNGREQRAAQHGRAKLRAGSTHLVRWSRERFLTAASRLMGLTPCGRMAQTVHSKPLAWHARRMAAVLSCAGSNIGTSKASNPCSRKRGRMSKCLGQISVVQANALTPIFIHGSIQEKTLLNAAAVIPS